MWVGAGQSQHADALLPRRPTPPDGAPDLQHGPANPSAVPPPLRSAATLASAGGTSFALRRKSGLALLISRNAVLEEALAKLTRDYEYNLALLQSRDVELVGAAKRERSLRKLLAEPRPPRKPAAEPCARCERDCAGASGDGSASKRLESLDAENSELASVIAQMRRDMEIAAETLADRERQLLCLREKLKLADMHSDDADAQDCTRVGRDAHASSWNRSSPDHARRSKTVQLNSDICDHYEIAQYECAAHLSRVLKEREYLLDKCNALQAHLRLVSDSGVSAASSFAGSKRTAAGFDQSCCNAATQTEKAGLAFVAGRRYPSSSHGVGGSFNSQTRLSGNPSSGARIGGAGSTGPCSDLQPDGRHNAAAARPFRASAPRNWNIKDDSQHKEHG